MWQSPRCRVVRVDSAEQPGFCRVVWQSHVREMTDLSLAERSELMSVVWAVEDAVRVLCRPDKVNLASFGNMTPHLHWHIIPRWCDDPFFPEPIWGNRQRHNPPSRNSPSDDELSRHIAAALTTSEGILP